MQSPYELEARLVMVLYNKQTVYGRKFAYRYETIAEKF